MSTYQLTRPLYTIQQTMDMLSYSRSTINRMVSSGKLHKIQLGANSARITAASLEALMSSCGMGSQMGSQQAEAL